MLKFLLLVMISLLINACSGSLAVGTAEVTGVALFNDRRSLEKVTQDEQIEAAINLKLLADDNINQLTHFNVTVFNGLVLMTGETPSQQIKTRINALAHSVSGVRFLKNYMRLATLSSVVSRANDSMITTQIKLRLSTYMSGLDSARIKVITENSEVFLMGLVYQQEADIATDYARRVTGVKRVIKVFEFQ